MIYFSKILYIRYLMWQRKMNYDRRWVEARLNLYREKKAEKKKYGYVLGLLLFFLTLLLL